jgi:hypothetical protein
MKIRLIGLLLIGLSTLSFGALSHLVHDAPGDQLFWLKALLGLACVGTEMVGLPLLALGAGLFARVDVPARSWYPWTGDAPNT